MDFKNFYKLHSCVYITVRKVFLIHLCYEKIPANKNFYDAYSEIYKIIPTQFYLLIKQIKEGGTYLSCMFM